jgi:DNA polymerase V
MSPKWPTYALVDCNSFYCSCERLFRPDLRQVPVVVLSNNDCCVIARTPEARELGIKMGYPFFKIRDALKAKGMVAFSSHYELYGDHSSRVQRTIESLAPRVEVYSIDESFADLTGIAEPLGDSKAEILLMDLRKRGEFTGICSRLRNPPGQTS